MVYEHVRRSSPKLRCRSKSSFSRFSWRVVHPDCRYGGDGRCASRRNTVCRRLQHDRDATTEHLQLEPHRHVDFDQDGSTPCDSDEDENHLLKDFREGHHSKAAEMQEYHDSQKRAIMAFALSAERQLLLSAES